MISSLRKLATKEQESKGWETAVRIEKIIATVLNEAHKYASWRRRLSGPSRNRGFYGQGASFCRNRVCQRGGMSREHWTFRRYEGIKG